jgi:hypothetical protein
LLTDGMESWYALIQKLQWLIPSISIRIILLQAYTPMNYFDKMVLRTYL